MDWRDIAIGLLTLGSGAIGWFLRELWSAVQSLRKDLQMLQNSLPGTYARRDDVRDMFGQIMEEIRGLRADLQHKMDKP